MSEGDQFMIEATGGEQMGLRPAGEAEGKGPT